MTFLFSLYQWDVVNGYPHTLNSTETMELIGETVLMCDRKYGSLNMDALFSFLDSI